MARVMYDTHQTEITEVQKDFIGKLFGELREFETNTRIVNAHGTKYTFNLKSGLAILLNSAFDKAEGGLEKVNFVLNGKKYKVEKKLGLSPEEQIINYEDENGLIYAQYDPKILEFKVLFDVMAHESYEELLKVIFENVKEIHLKEKNKDSYKFGDGNALLQKLTLKEVEEAERIKEVAKQDIESHQRSIKQYREEIMRYYKRVDAEMRKIKLVENIDQEKALEKLQKEFNSILELDKITDIRVQSSKIILETDDIYCYHDVNIGERYYIGKFLIKLDLENGTIYFNNLNNRRKSYWGEECSHPHVNEDTWGGACFGNVDATIAELSHQREYYALATIAIDFLENVNTSDSAGEYIRSWDIVDDEGNVLQEGSSFDDAYDCECCDETVEYEDTREVVTSVNGDGSVASTERWCEICIEDACWDDHSDEYYSNDAYSELEEVRREEERFDIITEIDEDGDATNTERYTEDEADAAGLTYLYDDELGEYVTYEVYEQLEVIRNKEEETEEV